MKRKKHHSQRVIPVNGVILINGLEIKISGEFRSVESAS